MNSPKRVLIIKLTSMGDLTHTLTALTDAVRAFPGIEFDWVVDESFQEIPGWHSNVRKVIATAHRRWRKHIWSFIFKGELSKFLRTLNADDYDYVIDMQNNIKSAAIIRLRRGIRYGLDRDSVREWPAYLAYQKHIYVSKELHAIQRQRQLLAKVLGYDISNMQADYGVPDTVFSADVDLPKRPYLVFVHNASWDTKLWIEDHWLALINIATQAGYRVVLPSGSADEFSRAQRLAKDNASVIALPRISLTETGTYIRHASGVVSCDTGLAHISAVIGRPTITFYGPTSDKLVGAYGKNQQHLVATEFECAPCYKRYCNYEKNKSPIAVCMKAFTPDHVWQQLTALMRESGPISPSKSE